MELKYNNIYIKGKEEEKERWIIKIISYGLKQNLSLEEIASFTEISVEEVEQYIKENCLN
jgi:predicted transposase YdaD